MPKKKTDPLDERLKLTCLGCDRVIEVSIREARAARGVALVCPNCGEKHDARKAIAEITRRTKEKLAPLQKVIADLRAQKKKKV